MKYKDIIQMIFDVYPRNTLPKIKNGEYAINLDEDKLIGTHWMTLYVNSNITCFDIFGVEYIKLRS